MMTLSVICRLMLLVVLFLFSITTAAAIKPVRNLQVSCRDQTYVIHDVTTVEELMNRLQRSSGIPSSDIQPAKVLHKGKVLERDDLLRQKGVHDGSTLIVVTDNYRMKGKEVLAMFLEMLNEDNWVRLRNKWRSDNVGQALHEQWNEMKFLQSRDISSIIRNSLDLSYHTLRRAWEHPIFRQSLSDPRRIEAYRIVVASHLSKKILRDIPGAKHVVESPELWRKQVIKYVSGLIRFGDVLLDGILEIVLDVLKGAGKGPPTVGGLEDQNYEPTMEDPSLANNLLFELSESEDED